MSQEHKEAQLEFHPDVPLREKVDEVIKRKLDKEIEFVAVGSSHPLKTATEFMIDYVLERDSDNEETENAEETDGGSKESKKVTAGKSSTDMAEIHAALPAKGSKKEGEEMSFADRASASLNEESSKLQNVSAQVKSQLVANGPLAGAGFSSSSSQKSQEEEEEEEWEPEDPFYVVDLSWPARKYMQWKHLFPRVHPFYAVKCNPDRGVIKTLAACGAGFDCASKAEINLVLDEGVDVSRIVFANPCKAVPELKFAKDKGVYATTFDNAEELQKIKTYHPKALLLLRIFTEDSHSNVPLGKKFGAPLETCENLLLLAAALSLKVIGVSFHVGSGCYDAVSYSTAIGNARKVFDMAKKIMGRDLELLDIGGGYPGVDDDKITMSKIATFINDALDKYFPPRENLKIISEPGRFFVEASHTLCVEIIAKNDIKRQLLTHSRGGSEAPSLRNSTRPPQDSMRESMRLKSSSIRASKKKSGKRSSKRREDEGLAVSASPGLKAIVGQGDMLPISISVTGSDSNSKLSALGNLHAPESVASEANKGSVVPGALRVDSGNNDTEAIRFQYHINEGVYGSFKDRVLVEEKFEPHILWCKEITDRCKAAQRNELVSFMRRSVSDDASLAALPRYNSALLGPSGHPLDVICQNVPLPELDVGDWLYFSRMGAYTTSLASCFQGHEKPNILYIWSDDS